MTKKNNIVSRALAKLSLMQKQLTEESQVLDELKVQEEADDFELGALQTELGEKNTSIFALNEELKKLNSEKTNLEAGLKKSFAEFKALSEKEEDYKRQAEAARSEAADCDAASGSLREELKRLKEENVGLSHKLVNRAAEGMAALDRERADFRLNYEKMEACAADAEKRLLNEIDALRESLRLKTAEASRAVAEKQAMQDAQDALKADHEARLLKLEALNASLLTQREAGLLKIKEQDIFSKSAVSALREKDDDLRLLEGRIADLGNDLDKSKADSQRRSEILRLELEEKNRHTAYLGREIEKHQAETESLKAELAVREKEFRQRLENERKGLRLEAEKN